MAILHPNYSDLNYDEMAKSIGLKPKHIPLLLSSFLEESEAILPKLKISIENNSYEEIREAAHSIKGSAGNMRFNEIYEMAKEMELSAADANGSFEYTEYLEAITTAVASIKI